MLTRHLQSLGLAWCSAILTSTSCHAGPELSMTTIRILTRTCAYMLLFLKELSFLTSPLWVAAQPVSSTRIGAFTCPHPGLPSVLTVTAAAPGHSAVLLTLLAGWDAPPCDFRAAIAWGIISAARYTHLQAGTLKLGHCIAWQTAGESGVLAWRMLLAQLHQRLDSSSTSISHPACGSPVQCMPVELPAALIVQQRGGLPPACLRSSLQAPHCRLEAALCLSAPPVHSSNPNHRRMCLAAGLVLIVLPRLPPVKAVVKFLTGSFRDPDDDSPVMIAAGCVSDALFFAALLYLLPCMVVVSTCGPNLPPQPSRTTPGEQLPLDACSSCRPGAQASVDSLPVVPGFILWTQPYGCNIMTAWQLARCDWVALLCISQPGSFPALLSCHDLAWSYWLCLPSQSYAPCGTEPGSCCPFPCPFSLGRPPCLQLSPSRTGSAAPISPPLWPSVPRRQLCCGPSLTQCKPCWPGGCAPCFTAW